MPKPTLFHLLETPVKANPEAIIWPFVSWGVGIWLAGKRRPTRSWPARLGVGFLSACLMTVADYTHTAGHIISARYANAPMDQVRLSLLPMTLYYNNDVSPQAHKTRAIGGPIINLVALLVSLIIRAGLMPNSLARELADTACLANAFFFAGSLAPLPILDGGVLVKWTLVEQGHTPDSADALLQRVNLTLSATGAAVSLILGATRRWPAALALFAASALGLAAGLGKLK